MRSGIIAGEVGDDAVVAGGMDGDVPLVVSGKACDEVGLGGATDLTREPDGIEGVLIDAAGFVGL